MNVGKVFFIVAGWVLGAHFGSPILGLILGWYVGSRFDQSINMNRRSFRFDHTPAQTIFFKATFSVMGYIAKADGHISDNEIKTAEHIMQQMRLTSSMKKEAVAAFRYGKSSAFILEDALKSLRVVAALQPPLIQLFIEIQLQAARADGSIGPNKKRILEHIIKLLGGQHHQSWQNNSTHVNQSSLQQCYDVLGVKSGDSGPVIKKAYRKLMGQYHPDRMVAKGLPEEMMKLANKKTQDIKKAYDTIRQYRGF
jgi:DnaJ like chaperone protein